MQTDKYLHSCYFGEHRVSYEQFKTKEQIIQELKEHIKYLQNEYAKQTANSINKDSAYIVLEKSFVKLQRNLKVLSKENEMLKRKQNSSIDSEYMKKLEEERDYYQLRYEREKLEKSNLQKRTFDIFQNCDTLEKLKKRKKALLGIYHPDDPCGDNEIARIILEQYNRKKAYLK